jgi:hypothetical protein
MTTLVAALVFCYDPDIGAGSYPSSDTRSSLKTSRWQWALNQPKFARRRVRKYPGDSRVIK